MNKNWDIKTLGKVCEKIENISWSNFPTQNFQYIDLTSVSRDSLSVTNSVLVNIKNAPSRAKKIVQSGDVIFGTTRPTLKRVAKISEDYDQQLCSTGFAVLRAKQKEILTDYIFFFLQTDIFNERMERLQRGASYPAVSDTDVKSTKIPLPPLSEQKRIVGILDEKFKAIEELKKVTEAQIQDAKELFESRLNIIFGMNEENILPLSDVCKITSSKRVYKADYVKSGVPFYRTKEIKELAHNKQPTTELFIKRDSFDEITSKFGKPEAGDLMLTAIGTIGEIYIVEDKDEFYFKDGNILWLKNIKGVTVGYLRYALNFFVKEIQSLAVGSAYKALTIEKLNNHKIPVPKKEIQNDTVKELDELSIKTQELMEVFQNKIINLEELKKSYLEQAFAGKL
jgi:type I restriction enzyme S subunit